jgi:hypothetical protein
VSGSRYAEGWRDCALALAAELATEGSKSANAQVMGTERRYASNALHDAAEMARRTAQDGPGAIPGVLPVPLDGAARKIGLSVSPRSCMWCLWDITQVSGEGAWRLAWWSSSDEAEVADPYHCDGHADGVHVPKAEVAP